MNVHGEDGDERRFANVDMDSIHSHNFIYRL